MVPTINQHCIYCFAATFSMSYKETLVRPGRLHLHVLIIAISNNLLAQSNGGIWDRKVDMSWF